MDVPVFFADVLTYCGHSFHKDFWGPKFKIIDAYKTKGEITSDLFSTYIIPQAELAMAVKGDDKLIIHEEKIWIAKIRDENYKEYDPFEVDFL